MPIYIQILAPPEFQKNHIATVYIPPIPLSSSCGNHKKILQICESEKLPIPPQGNPLSGRYAITLRLRFRTGAGCSANAAHPGISHQSPITNHRGSSADARSGLQFHFVYPVPFTHWVLQSSTNPAVGWHNRDHLRIPRGRTIQFHTIDLDDGSILAHLPLDPANAREFYRVVGDTI